MKFLSQLSNSNKLDCGSSLIEVALVTPVLLLLLLGTFDFGLAFFTAIEVAGAAHAGAEYGIQNPSDSAGIQAAAIADAPDVSGLTISTPAYGCECSDGTAFSATCSSTPSCTNNVVYRVTVNASTTYKPLFPWPGIPSAIPLSQSATMRSGGS